MVIGVFDYDGETTLKNASLDFELIYEYIKWNYYLKLKEIKMISNYLYINEMLYKNVDPKYKKINILHTFQNIS